MQKTRIQILVGYIGGILNFFNNTAFERLKSASKPGDINCSKEHEERKSFKPGRDWAKTARNLFQ